MNTSREAIDHYRIEDVRRAANFKSFDHLTDLFKKQKIVAEHLLRNPADKTANLLFDYNARMIITAIGYGHVLSNLETENKKESEG